MSGRRSRQKGAKFERDIAKALGTVMPGVGIRRGLQSQGEVVPDVEAPGLWVECKCGNYASKVPTAALRQAEKASVGTSRHAVAVVRPDRKRAQVYLRVRTLQLLLLGGKTACNGPSEEGTTDELVVQMPLAGFLSIISGWWGAE